MPVMTATATIAEYRERRVNMLTESGVNIMLSRRASQFFLPAHHMRRTIISLLSLAAFASVASAQQAAPLDLDDVIELLRLSSSAETRAAFIRKSCVTFPLTTGATTRLRSAGASNDLLEVIGSACFTGTEIVVESRPAGAEILIDGQAVGKAPWTGRYATAARPAIITARLNGSTQTANAPLDAKKRVRAMFAFRKDTVAVPDVRPIDAIVSELGLAAQWRPTVPAPKAPNAPSPFNNFVVSTLLLGGGAYGGYKYCDGATGGCGFKVELDEDGLDTNKPYRQLVGGLGGAVVGTVVNKIIGMGVNSVRRSSYEGNRAEYLKKQTEWNRAMDGARAEWLRTHPEVRRVLGSETSLRQNALDANREIKKQNSELPQSGVTVEPLGNAPLN